MTSFKQLTFAIGIVLSFFSLSVYAQSAEQKENHFSRDGISFDHPAGYSVTDESTTEAQQFIVTRKGSSAAKTEDAIQGIVLNGRAVALPKPEYPPLARAARVSGTVAVQVLIDEEGKVVAAHVVSGHPLLHAASLAAAQKAQFSPILLDGEPVRVTGVIQYNFVAQ